MAENKGRQLTGYIFFNLLEVLKLARSFFPLGERYDFLKSLRTECMLRYSCSKFQGF